MSQELYLQPVGLLYGETARQAAHQGKAGFIGSGDVGFQGLKIHTRDASENGKIISFEHVSTSSDKALTQILHLIQNPRSNIGPYDLTEPLIMGIVNTTPDSFSDGGDFIAADAAIAHGKEMAALGAHILDIGGESTRPGAKEVSRDEELTRTAPVVEALANDGFCVSIDSRKSEVMASAIEKGAQIINDVSAFQFDPGSAELAARADCPVVLMHAKGRPETMQDNPEYNHVVLDIYDELSDLIVRAEKAGVKTHNIIVDPGIGFGKTTAHNIQLMQHLSLFHGLGVPILLGASRKRFLGELTGEDDPKKRILASVAAAISAVNQGVQVVRVHDVHETVQGLKMIKNMQN